MWEGVKTLIDEIKKCERASASVSAVAMAYVCIDAMAYLSLPSGRDKQRKSDFISWTDTYLKGHSAQPYQYRGIDVYGARCAVLHSFSSYADFYEKNIGVKKFGYHDGGEHAYDPNINDQMVIIGMASFINDVVSAVAAFMDACQSDIELRRRVESRLPSVLASFPIKP